MKSPIIKAVVTEKSMRLSEAKQYSFVVTDNAEKADIAREVKRLFKVDVTSVHTITIPGKVKKRGSKLGVRSDVHKAIVRIKPNQTIAEFNVGE